MKTGGKAHRVERDTGAGTWKPSDESGLSADQVADLGLALFSGKVVGLCWDGNGFVAQINGTRWSPYCLLSELLADLGRPS